MNVKERQRTTKTPAGNISILVMDGNSERLALRKKIMATHGVEVIGAGDLTEASTVWHRDRYDMVLMDIRRDHRGCLAWRDEIKKESPRQIVAFLVGRPRYVDLEPLSDSYVAEGHGARWGDSLRQAVRESCESLPQRYSFAEAGWRIAAARKLDGRSTSPRASVPDVPAPTPFELAAAAFEPFSVPDDAPVEAVCAPCD